MKRPRKVRTVLVRIHGKPDVDILASSKSEFDLETSFNASLVSWFSKIKDSSDFDNAIQSYGSLIFDKTPDDLSLLSVMLSKLSSKKDASAGDIISLCDRIIGTIDTDKLAIHYGKLLPEGKEFKKQREDMDKIKKSYIEALKTKATTLLNEIGDDEKGEASDNLEEVLKELRQWVDLSKTDKSKHLEFQLHRFNQTGKHQQALKALRQSLKDQQPKEKEFDNAVELMRKLGWKQLANRAQALKVRNFPGSYPVF